MIRRQQGALLELVHFGLHWRVHRGICGSNDEINKVTDPSAVLHLQMRARAFTQCCMQCLISMKGRPPNRGQVLPKNCTAQKSQCLEQFSMMWMCLQTGYPNSFFKDNHRGKPTPIGDGIHQFFRPFILNNPLQWRS